jgi:hypothetical protein
MIDTLLNTLEIAEISGGKGKNYITSCDNICDDFCNDCAEDTVMELKPYKQEEKHYKN